MQRETIELIVRINCCQEKANAGFSMIDNYYKVQARFDKALDVRIGKMVGEGVGFISMF